ncbi:MAG: DUF6364 family protein [Nitrospiraceae bacterium]|nr:DUF6364 family protein [Nitrospiraceae bacterium]
MFTKLTLRMDDGLIKKTKKIAKARNVSLSEMVTEFFKSMTSGNGEEVSSPVLDEISGILAGKDRKALIGSYKRHIAEKYS